MKAHDETEFRLVHSEALQKTFKVLPGQITITAL